MSYNGFTWSPYYEQVPEQHGRNQSFDRAGPYPRHSFQPTTSAKASNLQTAHFPPMQNPIDCNPNSHSSRLTPVGSTNSSSEPARAGSQSHFDSRRIATHPNARTSIDTTAMGSLAYASSLAQERQSDTTPARYGPMQPIADYNRYSQPVNSSASSTSYGLTSTASNGYEHHHFDNRGTAVAREEYRPPEPQITYPPTDVNNKSSGGGYTQSYARVSTGDHSDPVTSRVGSVSHRREPNLITHPQRPASGQSTHLPQSRARTENNPKFDNRPAQSPTYVSPYYRSREGQSNMGSNETSNSNAEHPRQAEMQNPTTVDPSQIFNHYEYQRRQASAEAARKAAEEAAARKAEATKPAVVAASVDAPAAEADTSASRKDQMELEMKQMIEKMRDYKAKDPTLFSQIWEQVKKGQPANRSSPQAPVSAGKEKVNSPAELDGNDQLPSPNPAHLQLPLESELSVEPTEETRPDLGKFPLGRRRPSQKSMLSAAALRSESADSGGTTHGNPSPTVGSIAKVIPKTNEIVNQNMIPQAQPVRQVRAPPSIVHARGVGPGEPQVATSTQKPPKGSTIWPQGNKRGLAEAARLALTSGRINAGRTISTDEILMLLDGNPSYTELCESLERRGFIIDRGHFARTLLSAVSGADARPAQQSSMMNRQVGASRVNGPRDPQGQGALQQLNVTQGPHAGNPPPFVNVVNQQHNGFGMLMKTPIRSHGLPSASEVISRSAPHRIKPKHLSHAHPVNGVGGSAPPQRILPPLPPSKKDMARKRSFGEIVDLTQDLSDGDNTSQKAQRARLTESGALIANKPSESGEAITSDVDPQTSMKTPNGHSKEIGYGTPPSTSPQGDSRPDLSLAVATEEEALDLSKFKYTSGQRDLLQSDTVIRPMNKRNDALRRDNYNAKTIARDILLASGKHPTMAPLNYHLEILKKRFRFVDNNSDLSTFRWDLVDPGGPADAGTSGEANDHDVNDADDEGAGLEEASHRGQLLLREQRQIALTTNGNHDVMTDVSIQRPIKNLPTLRKFKASRSSQTATQGTPVDSALVIPDEPVRSSLPGDVSGGLATGSDYEGEMSFQRIPDGQSRHNVPNPSTSQAPSPRPRGRPPGSGKKRGNEQNEGSIPSQAPEPRRRGRPLGSKDTTPRKRPRSSTGPLRQSSLRNVMTSPGGVAVLIESRPRAVEKHERQNRKDKDAAGKPRQIASAKQKVHHQVYKCRWSDCPYELHNLQTLRKHVHKHRESFAEGPFPCYWADCGTINLDEVYEKEDELIRLEFDTDSAWHTHIDTKHLEAIAWELGDGPSAPPSDADTSDYLSDARGRRVTPLARTTGPPDPLPLNSSRAAAEEYHKAHGNLTERDKAKSIFRAYVEKKNAQGYGMTRMGSRVITKAAQAKADIGPPGGMRPVPPGEL